MQVIQALHRVAAPLRFGQTEGSVFAVSVKRYAPAWVANKGGGTGHGLW